MRDMERRRNLRTHLLLLLAACAAGAVVSACSGGGGGGVAPPFQNQGTWDNFVWDQANWS